MVDELFEFAARTGCVWHEPYTIEHLRYLRGSKSVDEMLADLRWFVGAKAETELIEIFHQDFISKYFYDKYKRTNLSTL